LDDAGIGRDRDGGLQPGMARSVLSAGLRLRSHRAMRSLHDVLRRRGSERRLEQRSGRRDAARTS
jgi:hypothetical protein